MLNPEFRPLALACGEDRAAIKRIFRETPSYVFATGGSVPEDADVDEMLDSVAKMLPRESIATRLITCPGIEEAGFLMVARGHPDPLSAYLIAVILTSRAQGQSLGVAALEEVEALAAGWSCRRLMAVVDSQNARALRFWRREGFVEEGRSPAPRFMGDAVRISKELVQRSADD